MGSRFKHLSFGVKHRPVIIAGNSLMVCYVSACFNKRLSEVVIHSETEVKLNL